MEAGEADGGSPGSEVRRILEYLLAPLLNDWFDIMRCMMANMLPSTLGLKTGPRRLTSRCHPGRSNGAGVRLSLSRAEAGFHLFQSRAI